MLRPTQREINFNATELKRRMCPHLRSIVEYVRNSLRYRRRSTLDDLTYLRRSQEARGNVAACSRRVRNQFQDETGLELVSIGFSAPCETVPRPRLALVPDISRRLERRLSTLRGRATMADITEQKGDKVDAQMEIKVEPTMQCYIEEEHENGFPGFESNGAIPSSVDVGALNLWTSKATTCLIGQYKKYRSMVGQSTQIRSLREMFEMISVEMQNYGFYFSPQKCENKWRVLERKYKNLVFRERLKKPGRMRHYGHWEHKRALDEIFNEKKRHMYLEENDFPPPAGSAKYTYILPKPANEEQSEATEHRRSEDPLGPPSSVASTNNKDEGFDQKVAFGALVDKFFEEMTKNFAVAEKNREKRHKEEMAMRQNELEIQKRLLKLKEQKLELQKCQIIAAAQHLHLNM